MIRTNSYTELNNYLVITILIAKVMITAIINYGCFFFLLRS